MLRRTIVAAFVGIALTRGASACPNCKEAVAAQPSEVQGMARGYNYSVLFMLTMPVGLLGGGAILVSRAVKNGSMPEW
jgi:hypothetical protein